MSGARRAKCNVISVINVMKGVISVMSGARQAKCKCATRRATMCTVECVERDRTIERTRTCLTRVRVQCPVCFCAMECGVRACAGRGVEEQARNVHTFLRQPGLSLGTNQAPAVA